MNDDALARIDLLTRIDLLIDVLDAPDEEGVVWRDDEPYDLGVVTEGKVPTPPPIRAGQWLVVVLLGVGLSTILAAIFLSILWWSIYAALSVVLWLLVNSVS